jgi:hypothetical protein
VIFRRMDFLAGVVGAGVVVVVVVVETGLGDVRDILFRLLRTTRVEFLFGKKGDGRST